MPGALTLTRVAHATTLLDFSGELILTDPWFSEKPGYYHGEPLGVRRQDLPRLTGVAGSHGHYDHFDMADFAAYPDKNVPFAVKSGMARAAHKAGFHQVTELEPWQTAMLGNVKVTATPAKHGVPENCYVLEKDGATVFFGGDTLLIPELREIARRFPSIDLALLPVNGLQIRPMFNRQVVMNAKEAAELCAILLLAAELYDHHSAGFGEDVSAGLPDHAAAHQEQGAAPLTCQPRLRRGPSLASLITALTGDRLTPWPDGRYG